MPAPRTAHAYGRYSSGQQGGGHSEERQDALALDWCRRHGVELDTSTVYMDRGTSAFRGKHRKAGSPLRCFLEEVKAERIARGSILIIENLDRLSRENPWDAVPLLCEIVNAGLDVVTLSPSEVVYTRSGDLTGLILAVVEFGRGHSESKSKSDRLAAVWDKRKRAAREEGAIITHRLPAWVQEVGGKLVPIPERVVIVRRMFELAAASAGGCGLFEIVRTLTREKVPGWGRKGLWTKAYVHKILTGKVVLGEHQPRKNGLPDGEPLPDYYPRVIEPALWERVQEALTARKDLLPNGDPPGRVGEKVTNLFSGMLTEALSGQRMLIAWQTYSSGANRRKVRVLLPAGSMEGRQRSVSFPYPIFEEAVLRLLREVSPADVVGGEDALESTALAVEAAALKARMDSVEAELFNGDAVPALARVLRQLDTRYQDVLRRLAAARAREANPTRAVLAEAQTLLSVAVDEASRLRLRRMLSQLVQAVHVLLVPRGGVKLCAVQVSFREGNQRSYLIVYRPGRRGSVTRWDAVSVPHAPGAAPLDLRRQEDAQALAATLERLDLTALATDQKGE